MRMAGNGTGWPTRLIRDQKGATAAEFALVLLPLIMLLFGIIEWGLLAFNQQLITNAAREGARAGIIVSSPRLTNAQINQVVRNFCEQYLVTFGSEVAPTVTIPPVGTNPAMIASGAERCLTFGCDLTVTVAYNYDFMVLANLGIGPVRIESEARMRME